MTRALSSIALFALVLLLAAVVFVPSLDGTGMPATTWQAGSNGIPFSTAVNYLVTFYPRWLTYQLSTPPTLPNTWIGPERMGPVVGAIVAPNDDTLYVLAMMDLSREPVIVTIPETRVTYSLLTMDAYGNVFQTNIQKPNATAAGMPGIYGLIGPGWKGTLPPEVKPIPVPVTWSVWIVRADKYSHGQNQILQGEIFRRSLLATPLSRYLHKPQAGRTRIFPAGVFSDQNKLIADQMVATDPIEFLTQLQAAVKDRRTPPLSNYEQQVSSAFDSMFADPQNESEMAAGAQQGHALILQRYLSTVGETNWITFTNIGAWGTDYLARSAIAEYLLFGNTHSTAAYYHAFKDLNGNLLDTNVSPGYILTFPAGEAPEARRFWSVTMYTPDSITLVKNAANKYVVASYTPNLAQNPDGSISIYIYRQLPPGIPPANWLPAPQGQFDVMLRVYGPEGSVATNDYVPPGLVPSP